MKEIEVRALSEKIKIRMSREETGGKVGQTKSSEKRIIVRDSQLKRRKVSSTNESVLISLLDFSS